MVEKLPYQTTHIYEVLHTFIDAYCESRNTDHALEMIRDAVEANQAYAKIPTKKTKRQTKASPPTTPQIPIIPL